MGLQSLAFYTAIAWLPSVLAEQGMSTTAAGWMLFYYQLVALVTGMVLPLLTRGRHDQRFAAAAASVIVATGFAILLVLPALAVVACTRWSGERSRAVPRWSSSPRGYRCS
ncbi:MFS transporter [Saccharopolyspora elongata]|uniref:hypothetical protein n=1 Tax=Saccharopolyspora elongata TaxID=2530387 RepID=UPI001F464BAB|nr:hypothetical protein [Saccharopolyspora elongata]